MKSQLRYAFYALAAVVFAEYLFTSWTWLAWNRLPGLGQDVWLMGALAVREGTGLAMGNDHPLYTFILSLWAGRTPAVFTLSKFFSFVVMAATLGATYRVGRELFGRPAGVLAAALLSVNWIILSLSMSLRAEVLLPLFFLLYWYCVWRGFKESGWWWLGGGVFAGLAFLTKGTGTLLAAAWVCGLLAGLLRDRGLLRKAPWFLAGYLPLAALLWWGNSVLFDDAGYNFSVRHAMWLDSWEDLPNRTAAELTLGGFVARHGLTGVLSRLCAGILRFVPVSLSCLSPAESFPLAYVLRWPLLAAGAASLWRARRRILESLKRWEGPAWFTLSLWGIFFVLFAWYQQVSSSERFIGPLNPMLSILAAAVLVRGGRDFYDTVLKGRDVRRYTLWAVRGGVGLALIVLAIKVFNWGLLNPFVSDRPAACYRYVHAQVDGAPGPVLFGPSGELTIWYLKSPPPTVAIPEGEAPADLAVWLKERNIRRVVVDWDMASRPFLRTHFRSAGDRGVAMTRMIPGWRVVYIDGRHSPPHVIMLEPV